MWQTKTHVNHFAVEISPKLWPWQSSHAVAASPRRRRPCQLNTLAILLITCAKGAHPAIESPAPALPPLHLFSVTLNQLAEGRVRLRAAAGERAGGRRPDLAGRVESGRIPASASSTAERGFVRRRRSAAKATTAATTTTMTPTNGQPASTNVLPPPSPYRCWPRRGLDATPFRAGSFFGENHPTRE
jgi:hypothetical protein